MGVVADAEADHEFHYLARHPGRMRERHPVTAGARISAVRRRLHSAALEHHPGTHGEALGSQLAG